MVDHFELGLQIAQRIRHNHDMATRDHFDIRVTCPKCRTHAVGHQNETMRVHMQRSIPLNDGFSKKIENHAYAVALHIMCYNFVRFCTTLRTTPAMTAGVTSRLWEIGDIVKLVEDTEAKAAKRRPYKNPRFKSQTDPLLTRL